MGHHAAFCGTSYCSESSAGFVVTQKPLLLCDPCRYVCLLLPYVNVLTDMPTWDTDYCSYIDILEVFCQINALEMPNRSPSLKLRIN